MDLTFSQMRSKKEYEGRLDEIPGLFAEMKPMLGAIEAMHTLQEHFDLYSPLEESFGMVR